VDVLACLVRSHELRRQRHQLLGLVFDVPAVSLLSLLNKLDVAFRVTLLFLAGI
jgi:hypothetical protein